MMAKQPPTPLVICDLDGTLLRSDARLSGYARDHLNRLLDTGLHLTVASARGTDAIRRLLDGVELRLPVIELNGAYISELGTGRHLVAHILAPGAAGAATKLLLEEGADPVLTTWDGAADRVRFSPAANAGSTWYIDEKRAYCDPRLTETDDIMRAAAAEAVATVVAFRPEDDAIALVGALRAMLGSAATVGAAQNPYVADWWEIFVQAPKAEKGAAIAALVQEADLDATPIAIIVYGDHLNDLGMFAVADRAIAPANAHPDVLRRATTVVAANDEDGVIHHLVAEHLASGHRADRG